MVLLCCFDLLDDCVDGRFFVLVVLLQELFLFLVPDNAKANGKKICEYHAKQVAGANVDYSMVIELLIDDIDDQNMG